ncbi:FAD-dependent oxidoreductase-like enzyme [Coniochaeta hoffmannii]|uniref:FAD-dependent oxidoreductase-like enzyme n=1 Tax=Coniochaeta hoffmannii TaxID=91930 RepID=A0AA38S3L0_9PEZI|nr:FAD-dependent oxidoreductase-like enzyme [Coniochaeta hoffmannii]
MSLDAEQSAQPVIADVDVNQTSLVEEPSTPPETSALLGSSQVTIPSTEGALSPIEPSGSFKTEMNDDRMESDSVVPSSLTPPPSSQLPTTAIPAGRQMGYVGSQQSGIFSPPATALRTGRPDGLAPAEFTPPTPKQVVEAGPDELRSYLQACIAEHAKLKMEAAHHKLQYNLLSLQADEDAKRAAVEHEMTRREVDALRMAEHSRQARHELSAASETAHAKYLQLRVWYEQAVEEIESLSKRLKLAKKVIKQKTDEISSLTDERDMLLNRIRENREHFHALCSPGGMFHAAATPKAQTVSTPQQYRATPRQTPKSVNRERGGGGPEAFDALIKAATQENNSAPSTPTTSYRPAPRLPTKHTRNVQSMSSLPTTPTSRPRAGDQAGLLPSADLVPQTEPPRYGRFVPETPTPSSQRRKSRESTISVEDAEDMALVRQQHNEELARQAYNSFTSRSGGSGGGGSLRRRGEAEEEEEVYESQASQAASAMLRRDPRESFEVASSIGGGSRDGTPLRGSQVSTGSGYVVPSAAEKSAKLQAKLFAGLNKTSGVVAPGGSSSEKRKFSGGAPGEDEVVRREREALASPTKKLRMAGGLRDPGRVGLGIRYDQDR